MYYLTSRSASSLNIEKGKMHVASATCEGPL